MSTGEPTLFEIYAAIVAVDKRLAIIEATAMAENEARKDHEARLRTVERWVYGIPATIVLAVGSMVATVIR